MALVLSDTRITVAVKVRGKVRLGTTVLRQFLIKSSVKVAKNYEQQLKLHIYLTPISQTSRLLFRLL